MNDRLGIIKDKPDVFTSSANTDNVNHPSHYTEGRRYETLDKIDDMLANKDFPPSVAYALGSAIKYLDRCGHKDPDGKVGQTKEQKMIEDLKKADFYIKTAILSLEGKSMPEVLKELH